MSILEDIAECLADQKSTPELGTPPLFVPSIQERETDMEKMRTLKLSNSCPLCGVEMGREVMARLSVDERSWTMCSIPCALAMFRRQVPHPMGTASLISK